MWVVGNHGAHVDEKVTVALELIIMLRLITVTEKIITWDVAHIHRCAETFTQTAAKLPSCV